MTEFEEDCIKWRGKILTGKHAHYCYDWDFLPVDETCPEYECCHCITATAQHHLTEHGENDDE